MKSKHLLLTLLLAIGLPWAANAQDLTVCDGSAPGTTTSTNQYVPVYGYMADTKDYTSEFIIPSADLASIIGMDITKLTFSLSSPASAAWTATFKVYMKEVTNTTITSMTGPSTSTVVYTGTLDASGSTMVVNFDDYYTYNGGNLLIGTTISVKGNYKSATFSGISAPAGSSAYASSPTSNYPNTYGFLPATTLTYQLPSNCKKPTGLEATLTPGNGTVATLNWTENGTATSWVLEYGTASDFTGATSEIVSGTPTKNLTGLTAEVKHYARVKPDCDTDGSLWSATCEFTPTNSFTMTVYDGTTTNSYIPLGSGNQDYYNHSEYIIPATDLASINGATLNSIKLYANYDLTTGSTTVYLREVSETTFSNTTPYGIDGSTTVYTGALTISSTDGMTVVFNEGYDYNGGNLLIGFYKEYVGSYTSGSFYGQNVTGASIGGYGSSAPSISQRNFIPKTTFTYVPNPTPKPKNLAVSNITSSGATLAWQAPANATPTGYEYQYKVSTDEWPAAWTSINDLSVVLDELTASTPYTFRVRANYAAGNSNPIETSFTTLDDCAFPTNLLAYTAPGEGTKATLSWRKGYDETAWVLQYATNNTFTEDLVELTSGFIPQTDPGLENVVVAVLNGLTPDQTYYAHVKADCGGGSTSTWSNVAEFTPSNYVDYTYGANASTTNSYIPFYGSYANDERTISQYIIPATELADVVGGTIRSLTYYTNSTPNWGTATVKVYVKEVNRTTFASSSASEVEDWETMTQVYNGSLTVSGGQMTITFDNTYLYGGGNLMIGIKMDQTGTSASVSWSSIYNSSAYTGLYAYYSTSYYSTGMSYNRSNYYPKTTINYQPTPYKYPVIDEDNCTFETTTAHIAWTVTGATPTGYQYQYKPASATEWPTTWTSVTAATAYADLSGLTPGSFYDFRVKALYDGGNESVVVDYGFFTECAAITTFPWSEKFEAYNAGDFSHPCWQNVHISGDGTYIFKVHTDATGTNSTHKLQLPDQSNPTFTKLRLPEMTLPSNGYQFVIDVYRSTYSTVKPGEGITVYASADGNLEGATKLAFIPRQYDLGNDTIPAVETTGWYTYELPIPMSGTCYIVLKGKNEYGQSTYMDNFSVEAIPSCARPSELDYDNVTNHSATIEWTAGDTEQTLWQIAYSKTDFDPNTANFDVTTVNTVDATANPYTFAGTLDAESTYYMYVRANCGTATEPDFGPWSRKGVSFTTDIACPKPTSLTYSNVKSTSVELRWVGHGEEEWLLEYMKDGEDWIIQEVSDSDVTHEEGGVVVYNFNILDPETEYYVKVRANCEASYTGDGQSDYSNEVTFTTTPSCAVENVTVSDITHYTANVSWDGESASGFTVKYRTAAGNDGSMLNEDFSSLTSGIPANWDNSEGTTTSDSYKWTYYNNGHNSAPCLRFNSYYNSNNNTNFLKTPAMNFPAGKTAQLVFWWKNPTGGDFSVYISTDGGTTKTPLKEGLTGQTTWKEETINLTGYEGVSNVTIHFKGTSNYGSGDAYIYLDEVVIGVLLDPGTEQTVSATDSPANLENLEAGTKYEVKVVPNCGESLASDWVSFTTVSADEKWFVTEGNWGTASNWEPAGAPTISQNVTLLANATIESTCVAEAKSINGTGTGTNAKTLTIENGGKLKHLNSSVRATVKKNITGYTNYTGESNGGYYLIANPMTSSVTPSEANGFLVGNYDLYNWSYSSNDGKEWRNYEASSFTLSSGTYGYLYANETGVTLTYTGTINSYTGYKNRSCSVASNPDNYDFPSWYLLGNPYMYDAYLANASTNGTALPYVKMNAAGDGFENVAAGTPIEPMEGFFYQGVTGATTAYVVTSQPTVPKGGQLNMNLSKGNKQLDNAIVVFGGNQSLGKMTFRANSSKVYMPQDGKDYAIVSTESNIGEMPVNFKAENNGTYNLSFNAEEVSFAYLHLIDNMTGIETDLLANPSYTFEARTTDYASRFKLVFATGSSTGSDTFAYYSNGNWVINNEGRATLQVVDVNGRILKSESINGCANVNFKAAAGIYMIRLVNGDNVKVQKVVVK